jgi:autoinducer 2-degrading protein
MLTAAAERKTMFIVCVNVHVKKESIAAFAQASIENARASLREPGIARFDVLQSSEVAERFLLVEVYRDAEAPGRHKATAHYQRWRDAVAEMIAEPRQSTKYRNVFPGEQGFNSATKD